MRTANSQAKTLPWGPEKIIIGAQRTHRGLCGPRREHRLVDAKAWGKGEQEVANRTRASFRR